MARGEKRIGMKMGLTSRAKMLQVKVNEAIAGRLTDAMLLEEGAELSLKSFIHPRAEPEIAFLIGKPLAGPVSLAEAASALDGIAPALEIIDSRYRDFTFTLPDVVADNSSAAGLVLGPWCDPRQDIANLGILLEIDGRAVEIGSSAAILGQPLRSLAMAARIAGQWGEGLKPGDVVLAGGATAARPLQAGASVRVSVQNLGQAAFQVRA
jgi:2-oxo-3-hexenedioate decarboxylase